MSIDKNLYNKLIQYSITLYVAALLFAPALSVAAELFTYALFFSSADYRKELYRFLKTPVGKAFTFFVVTIALGVIVGTVRDWIDWSVLWSTRKVFMLPIAAVVFMSDENAKEKFIRLMLIFATLVSVYGIISLDVIELPRGTRALAPFNGMLFAALLSVAAIFLLRAVGLFQSAVSLLSFGILSYALILVGSRSGYLAFTLMMFFILILAVNPKQRLLPSLNRARMLSLAFIVSSGAMLLHTTSQQRIVDAFNEFRQPLDQGLTTSIGQRKIFYVNTIEMLKSYSIIGAGTASFEKAYAHHLKVAGKDKSLTTRDPHNNYLKVWIEQGLVGLVALLWLLFSLGRHSLKSVSALMGGMVLAGWALSSMFNGHLGTFTEGRFFWAWTGVLLASTSVGSQSVSGVKS